MIRILLAALAAMIVARLVAASDLFPISGAGSGAVGFSILPLIF